MIAASKKLILFCCVVLFASACRRQMSVSAENSAVSQRQQQISSALRMKFGAPVAQVEVSKHVAVDMRLWSQENLPLDELLDANHPATRLTQNLVHELHSAMLENFSEMKEVPEPQVIVVQNDQTQAAVYPVGTCIPAAIVPESGNSSEAVYPKWLASFEGKLLPSSATSSAIPTTRCPSWTTVREDRVAAFARSLQKNSSSCFVGRQGNTITIKNECFSPLASPKQKIVGVMELGSASGIVVYSGLLKRLEQRHARAVIAHELWHYYRAHGADSLLQMSGVDVGQPRSYLYRIGEYTDRSRKPVPDHSSEMTALAKELGDTDPTLVYSIPGLKYHPLTMLQISQLFDQMDAHANSLSIPLPEFVKSGCGSLASSASLLSSILLAKGSYVTNADEILRKVNDSSAACVKALTLKNAGEWRQYFREGPDTGAGLSTLLNTAFRRSPQHPAIALPDAARIEAIVEQIDSATKAGEERIKGLALRAQDSGVGIYTSEQEADELTVYLLALAGFNPKDLVDALFKVLGEKETGNAFAPGVSECKKGFLNSWQSWTFKNRPWVPFFGQPNDIHPSYCFRIYDVDNEIVRQKLSTTSVHEASAQGWLAMQQML